MEEPLPGVYWLSPSLGVSLSLSLQPRAAPSSSEQLWAVRYCSSAPPPAPAAGGGGLRAHRGAGGCHWVVSGRMEAAGLGVSCVGRVGLESGGVHVQWEVWVGDRMWAVCMYRAALWAVRAWRRSVWVSTITTGVSSSCRLQRCHCVYSRVCSVWLCRVYSGWCGVRVWMVGPAGLSVNLCQWHSLTLPVLPCPCTPLRPPGGPPTADPSCVPPVALTSRLRSVLRVASPVRPCSVRPSPC